MKKQTKPRAALPSHSPSPSPLPTPKATEEELFRSKELMDLDMANCWVTQKGLWYFNTQNQWEDTPFNRELFAIYDDLGTRLQEKLRRFVMSADDVPNAELVTCRTQFKLIQEIIRMLPLLDADDEYISVFNESLRIHLNLDLKK